jgi:hypothetical protein
MIRTFAMGFVLAVSALPAFAQTADQKAAMVAAIANAGCRVNSGNNSAILSAAGLSEDAAAAVVQSLLDSGEAVIEGGDLVLKTGGC